MDDDVPPPVDLVCGRCAQLRPGVRPTTLALLSLDGTGRVRVNPIIRIGGLPHRIYRDFEARTGRAAQRMPRTFRSAPRPIYAPAHRFRCRTCGLDRWLRLKHLAEKVARVLGQQAHVLVVEPDGHVRPLRGQWWTH